jgi:hypothetical protein
MRVTLTEFIEFTRPDSAKHADVRELAFDSDVFLQTETRDPAGERKAFQQTQARNLVINQVTGDMNADGPGWLSSVHRRMSQKSDRLVALSPAGNSGKLEYLRVNFLRKVVGRLHQGEIEFLERVRTVYGPVHTWENTLPEDRIASPGETFVVLTSDRLAVADMSPRPGRLQDVELEATGNAILRGSSFSAAAQRISYVRSKDQVIAEGDGRNAAVITYQKDAGAPGHLKARKILFWPSTKLFELSDFQRLDVQDLPQLRRD